MTFFWTRDRRQILAVDLSGRYSLIDVFPGGRLSNRKLEKMGYRGFIDQSPDGNWLAVESPGIEVLEADGDRRFQISVRGREPRWCRRCNELFYRIGQRWYSAKVQFTPEFTWQKPQLAFETSFIDTVGWSYDVSPDGQRLLVVKRIHEPPRDRISIIQNWPAIMARQ